MTEFVGYRLFHDRLRDEDQMPVRETGIPHLLSENLVRSESELTRDLLCIVFLR